MNRKSAVFSFFGSGVAVIWLVLVWRASHFPFGSKTDFDRAAGVIDPVFHFLITIAAIALFLVGLRALRSDGVVRNLKCVLICAMVSWVIVFGILIYLKLGLYQVLDHGQGG